MKISLIGYMGSGKSHISKILSKKTAIPYIDLDKEISRSEKLTIPEIFTKKGEIGFRKLERELLEEIVASKESYILSLGGGTPAYYNNMGLINQNSQSFFLRGSVGLLCARLLLQKEKRPLIANIPDGDLQEFVAKHLFERNPYYGKAQFTIDIDGKPAAAIAEEIILKAQNSH